MNVVFLDYDGVVNTPMWDLEGKHCRFNFPEDNSVNNFQCVQWVSEFCQKYDYSIVVTSTWRMDKNYVECLQNGGLRPGIQVLGRTKIRHSPRGEEIMEYLLTHPEVEHFIILDDDDDMGELSDHLVLCDTDIGFNITKYYEAERLHKRMCSLASLKASAE